MIELSYNLATTCHMKIKKLMETDLSTSFTSPIDAKLFKRPEIFLKGFCLSGSMGGVYFLGSNNASFPSSGFQIDGGKATAIHLQRHRVVLVDDHPVVFGAFEDEGSTEPQFDRSFPNLFPSHVAETISDA